MATTIEYIEYVCDQIRGTGEVRYKKMFGEYMAYVNDKPLLLVCNNTVYIKKRPELEKLLKDADCGIPYGGSKEHYILDIDNAELAREVIAILEPITPLPKSRKKKSE
ncbi:MAG: transcriptional regulator [Clostridiales bacterium]|nr:transcriptional regulator [Clostridiales bacterium]